LPAQPRGQTESAWLKREESAVTIAVTNPTGHVGSHAVRMLCQAGVRPRLLLRNPDRLDAELRDHVELVVGDQRDAERTGQGLGWAITNLRPAH
jgi:nucleoside-diphosphate-sugar epimerase